jgi:L,D-peptidoglycan transpeptidase YkuD (ErfK/YbiS/YcfS/YnhG family)
MLYNIENNFNINGKQIITVDKINVTNKAILTFYQNSQKIFKTEAFIGKNGITANKVEADGKTPEGIYQLGLVFGTHDKKDIKLNQNIKYIKINKNLYWVDDIYSKYYNQLVDITKVSKDWKSAEHLIEYPQQYEYAIEIKTNSKNTPKKR